MCNHDARFVDLERLVNTSYVYRYRSTAGGLRVVKIILGTYPTALHHEIAGKGLMPKLLEEPMHYPGGYTMVEMEYLDPADGWASLQSFTGPADPGDVERACNYALQGLHESLGGKAVHGDLRAPNVFIRSET